MTVQQSNLRGALFSLCAFAVYATHDVLVKFLGGSYDAPQLIFFSVLFGFPLVTLLLMSDRTDGNLLPKHPWWTMIRSVTGVLNAVMAFYAFSKLPLAQCYAIFFAMPMLITLLAIPMLGERIGLHRGLAILVGLVGVFIVLRPGQVPLGLGHLAAVGGAVMGAMTSVIVRKIGKEERAVVLMLYPMVANFAVMAVALPFVYRPMPLPHLGMLGLMSVLGLLGGLLIIAAYRRAPAIVVAPMQYSQIIWAAIFGYFIFNESVDWWTGVGTAVIVASGIYIVLREDTPKVSKNRPVLEGRSRYDSGAIPKSSIWLRLFDRGSAGTKDGV